MFDLFGKKKKEEEAKLALEKKQQEELVATQKKEEARVKREAKKAEKLAKKQAEEAKKNSPKELATANGEPWVQVLNIEIDSENPGAGAFELDWNDIFVARLLKSGYQGKTDADVVDNWFQDICRHVVLETYQQEQADPEKRATTATGNRKDLGGGKAEFT
jgi:hypothetical protein